MLSRTRELVDKLKSDINEACAKASITVTIFNELNARINTLRPKTTYHNKHVDEELMEELIKLTNTIVDSVRIIGITKILYGWYEFKSDRLIHVWESDLQVQMCFGMDMKDRLAEGRIVQLRAEIIKDC